MLFVGANSHAGNFPSNGTHAAKLLIFFRWNGHLETVQFQILGEVHDSE